MVYDIHTPADRRNSHSTITNGRAFGPSPFLKEFDMKKIRRYGKILIVLVFAFILFNTPLMAEPIDQYHSSWHLVRETADEDGATFAAVYDLTGLDLTIAGNFANKNTDTVIAGGAFRISTTGSRIGPHEGYSAGTRWMFSICAKNYNNVTDTFSFNLIGWSKLNGMLQVIAEGDCVIGTQAVVVYPDGGDALGELVSETSVVYTHADKSFTVTNEAFDGVVVGMLARVTGTGFTDKIAQVTTVTDVNEIRCSGLTSSTNGTDATVQINPAFWIDTINLDQTSKWTSLIDGHSAASSGNKGVLEVINSGDNEVAAIVVDLTGIEWIQFVVYVADAATNEEAGDITVYGRRY